VAEQQSSYDQLMPTRVILFVALLLFVNICIVLALYTFLWQEPFHHVLAAEKRAFGETLSGTLQASMRVSGDRLYQFIFVDSGLERIAYDDLRRARSGDAAAEAIQRLRFFGTMLDNLFDYALLLSYRIGFLIIAMSYCACLILAVGMHGYVSRHRKRYGFGDTPLILNLWARTLLAYAIPITFFVWTLPFALNPYVLTASLALFVCGTGLFAFSLPKIA
jgi:hypothetical protein